MWALQFSDSGNSHLHSPTDQVRQMTPTHQSHIVTWSEPHASQYSQLQFYTQHLTLTILQQINIISRVAFHDSDSLVVRQQQTVFQRQQSPSAHWHFINQIMFLTTIRHDQLFSRLSLWVRQSLNRRWTDSTLSDWLPASVCVSAHQPLTEGRGHAGHTFALDSWMWRQWYQLSSPHTSMVDQSDFQLIYAQYNLPHTPLAGWIGIDNVHWTGAGTKTVQSFNCNCIVLMYCLSVTEYWSRDIEYRHWYWVFVSLASYKSDFYFQTPVLDFQGMKN